MLSSVMTRFDLKSVGKKFLEALPTVILTVLSILGILAAINFTRVEVVGEGNSVVITQPRVFSEEPCPSGWIMTHGIEPDSQKPFISCGTSDRHYMLTLTAEDSETSYLGYDLWTGRQLTFNEIKAFYE